MRLKTSWFMRMRVCEVMRNVPAPFRGGAGLSVQIDEKCLSDSFCGNRYREPEGERGGGAALLQHPA